MSTTCDRVQYQPPDEAVNREMISLLSLTDFIDTISNKDLFVIKERNTWVKSEYHEPFEFRLKKYGELSNHQYMVEFSIDSYIEYNRDKFHLKGYIMEASIKTGKMLKRYLFDLHNKMFSIYLPDKSIVIFDLEESPSFVTGSIIIKIDYHKYNRYI
ncbi:MAG: hypothetical protein PHG66_02065 [Candidatus Colwellbacteria bacterium]|nr:hypothetical protein [Candidatus Colwellbacteria bacterium]